VVLLSSKKTDASFPCPDFSLSSVDDKQYSLKSFSKSKSLLAAFICNHCPYVRAIEDRLIQLSKAFEKKDLSVVGICSNDPDNYPEDSKEQLFKRWQKKHYNFPYLLDHSQSVAKAFDAICTPDFFLFGPDRKLFYRGRLDDNWQDEARVKSRDLALAIKGLLANEAAPKVQKPSIGCSIKWL